MKPRSFVPPVVFSIYRRLGGRPEGPKIYPTFAAALEACQGFGYEEGNLLRCLRLKAEALRDRCKTAPPELWIGDLLALNAITASGTDVRVLDYGGGPGRHYFPIRAALPEGVRLHWCVVETPGLVREAKPLETDELTFVDSLAAARDMLGKPDVVFSSGALQCIPDPVATLAELSAVRAPWLVLARMGAANDGNTIAIVQNSRLSWNGGDGLPPGIQDQDARVAIIYVAKRDLDAVADGAGYRAVAYAPDPSGVETSVQHLVTGYAVLRQLG
jgi:putative methyltransferase (TIGR04325 family)